MTPEIKTWFPIAICNVNLSDKFKDDNQKFYERGLYYKENLKKKTTWECDTYTSLDSADMINDPVFFELIQEISNQVYQFAELFGFKGGRLVCTDSWINIASPGNFQEIHVHPISHFSVVYYVKVSKNCGNINFYSYTTNSDMFPLPIENNETQLSFNYCNYEPKESQLLIFRSNVEHGVNKNESNEDRVSISMNFTAVKPKGKV